ncbi:PREDICTED: Golgi apparatus membrane protein TVP23-like isoform X4 [Populus euphratica]|uniref:Golgi apparatus membrane protein TVP23 n=1 Tax=Populus euphratica TaxID=75702 RepID=A0AAJ6V4J5_POPEU|nr:PREDICTED: Golgi apparatus membrane protein TVP23-like isoform X4 [Populus euphratica]
MMDLIMRETYANPKTCFFPVALRWWNEQGESVSQSLARLNMKDSWLVWWTLFLNVHAAAWVILGIFSIKRFEADYVLVVAVCGSLSIANIAGFTKCRKASAGDKISTESKYHAVLTSLDVLKFLLIWKMVTCYCDHQNHETFFISMSRIQFLLAFDQD